MCNLEKGLHVHIFFKTRLSLIFQMQDEEKAPEIPTDPNRVNMYKQDMKDCFLVDDLNLVPLFTCL